MKTDSLENDLADAVGKPAATLIVERGEERHFLAEGLLFAAGGAAGLKFLDGFLEGLGISALGKALGTRVRDAMAQIGTVIADGTGDTHASEVITSQFAVLGDVAAHLTPHAGDEAARTAGERAVIDLLEEKGIPASEARRIAKAVGDRLVPAPP